MEREVFEWLDGWWDIAGEIACEPKNATTDNPWRWDGYVYPYAFSIFNFGNYSFCYLEK